MCFAISLYKKPSDSVPLFVKVNTDTVHTAFVSLCFSLIEGLIMRDEAVQVTEDFYAP